jgi:hypothetical protein
VFNCEVCGTPCGVEVFCGPVRVCLCCTCEAEDGRSPVTIAEARFLDLQDAEEEEAVPPPALASTAHRMA